MSEKSYICLWCGRYTPTKGADGLAECTRPDCIKRRVYDDEA